MNDADPIEVIRRRAEAATPGPWGWFGNIKHGGPYLATQHGGRVFVMQFARLGMRDAQPVFQVRDDPDHPDWGHMVKGADLAIYEADHRDDIKGFDNPDAEFIAHSREDVADLLTEVDRLRQCVGDALWALEDPHGRVSSTHLPMVQACLAEALHPELTDEEREAMEVAS